MLQRQHRMEPGITTMSGEAKFNLRGRMLKLLLTDRLLSCRATGGWEGLELSRVLLETWEEVVRQVLGAEHRDACRFSASAVVNGAGGLAVVQVLGLGDVQDAAFGVRVGLEGLQLVSHPAVAGQSVLRSKYTIECK